jgi:hypothetical protein
MKLLNIKQDTFDQVSKRPGHNADKPEGGWGTKLNLN